MLVSEDIDNEQEDQLIFHLEERHANDEEECMDGDKEKSILLDVEREGDNDIHEELNIEKHDEIPEISDDSDSNNESYEDW